MTQHPLNEKTIKTESFADRLSFYFALAVAGIALALLVFRAFFGVELTDEALYVAEPLLVAQGATPYVNGWFQCAGFALFVAPFTLIFQLLSGGTSGIVLFSRLIYLAAKLAVCIVAYCLLKNHWSKSTAIFYLLAFLVVTPHSIGNFSYNTVALLWLFLGGVCLYASFMSLSSSAKSLKMSGFGGAAFACCAFTYPSLIIVCIVVSVSIFLLEVVQRQNHRRFLCFVGGGFLIAILLVIYMLVSGGGISAFLQGLYTMLTQSVYAQVYNYNPASLLLSNFHTTAQSMFATLLYMGAAYLLSYPLFNKHTLPLAKGNGAVTQRHRIFWGFIVGYIVYLCTQLHPAAKNVYNNYIFIAISAIVALLLPLFMRSNRRRVLPLLLLIWVPAVTITLVTGLSYGGILTRYYFLTAAGTLVIPFTKWALVDVYPDFKISNTLEHAVSALMALLIMCALLGNYFAISYRDAPLPELTAQVTSGAYAGLYTTPQTKQAVEELEWTVRSYTDAEDSVLFLDWASFGYFMTDGTHCAPSSNDMTAYYYGINDPTMLYSYFCQVDTVPTKIIYVDFGRDPILSIELPDYQFNQFVHENYRILYEDRNASYPIVIYELRPNHTPVIPA